MRVTLADRARITELLPPQVAAPDPKVDAEMRTDSSFGQVLQGIGRELAHGEAATRSAIASMASGTQTEPAQLIALQMGVYRYSEAIDLASRLVDRLTGGVKTVLQGP